MPVDMLKKLLTGKLGVAIVLGMLLPAMAANVLGFRYGQLERSREVTRAFETFQVDSSYNYFYNGWGDIPFAIIGIDKNYTLRPGLWEPVELTPQKLRSWLRQMDIIYDGYPPFGSRILDDTGKPLGVWYSSKQWTTVIIEEQNQVAVFAPEPPGFGNRR